MTTDHWSSSRPLGSMTVTTTTYSPASCRSSAAIARLLSKSSQLCATVICPVAWSDVEGGNVGGTVPSPVGRITPVTVRRCHPVLRRAGHRSACPSPSCLHRDHCNPGAHVGAHGHVLGHGSLDLSVSQSRETGSQLRRPPPAPGTSSDIAPCRLRLRWSPLASVTCVSRRYPQELAHVFSHRRSIASPVGNLSRSQAPNGYRCHVKGRPPHFGDCPHVHGDAGVRVGTGLPLSGRYPSWRGLIRVGQAGRYQRSNLRLQP